MGGRARARSADGSGFTAVVSNVSPQFSRVSERKSRIPRSPRPAHSHRAGETPQRKECAAETEERECRGTPKERRSRDGGDWGNGGVHGEDKELGVGVEVGGVWVGWEGHARRKGRLKKAR